MLMRGAFDMPTLLSELNRDEGQRLKPHLDTAGKTTIGVGRNLTDVGISEGECSLLLENDVMRSIMWLDRHLPWWRSLDAVRQRVIINIRFLARRSGSQCRTMVVRSIPMPVARV
jgi:lysozyme